MTEFQEGADIVMPVACLRSRRRAAHRAESAACMVVGVDTDWTVSAAEYSDVVLTSVLKNMNVAVFEAIKSVQDGTFAAACMSAHSPITAWVSLMYLALPTNSRWS